jgi:endonuclease YncB( thermonuclease family)
LSWLAAVLAVLLLWPGVAAAAEVLQVRGATVLQLGDQNRSYTVELACIAVPEAQQDQALVWLRQALPRHTRVNLRPMGQNQGVLLARVQKIGSADDVGAGLIAAGLAQTDATAPGDCARVGS